jgi:malic enzyme
LTEQLQQAADTKASAEAERSQLAAEKEQLLPQLEQARWQNRQLEKRVEEAAAGRSAAEQVGCAQSCSNKVNQFSLHMLQVLTA